MTGDKMVGWHHQLIGHEFEQALEDGKGQGTWYAAVHGVSKNWTQLSNRTTTTPAGSFWVEQVLDVGSWLERDCGLHGNDC